MATTQPPEGGHESSTGSHAAGAGWAAELRDALAPRTVLLVVGVLGLQLGFILSYVGAFHQPRLTRMPIAVVAPQQLSARTVAGLDALPGEPLDAIPAADEATARQLILTRKTDAAFLVDPSGSTDTLLVASGAGPALADAADQTLTAVDAQQQRTVKVQDIVPLQPGDGRGPTSFYLVIGWIVGGYLTAAIIGVARGSRPATGSGQATTTPLLIIGGVAVAGVLLTLAASVWWSSGGLRRAEADRALTA